MSSTGLLKLAWLGLLVALFVIVSLWYGGNGKPLTAQEGQALLDRFRAVQSSPPRGEESFLPNIEAMIAQDDGKEFYAVNLEQLKSGPAAEGADRAYSRIVFPLLFKRAGHPVFVSKRAGLMLGAYGNEVDRVTVVRYRSLRDLIKMASEPAMMNGSAYKFAALEHAESLITRPVITFVHIRLTLALLLVLIGIAGLKLIAWRGTRKVRRNLNSIDGEA